MHELVSVRRRNRLKHHYTITSNVLIFGYRQLEDGAKLTYQAIDSFDWPDQAGERKGYAYPSIETLATLRGLNRRTIFRHVGSLEEAGLLKREVRAGRPTLLWIEEPSEEESDRYLSTVAIGRDTNVTPTRDTNVTPYKKEEREEHKTVNAEQSSWKGRRRRLSAEERAKRDWLANEMVRVCGDPRSLGSYRKMASTYPATKIFEALSHVKDATRRGTIKGSRGALITHLLIQSMIEEPQQ